MARTFKCSVWKCKATCKVAKIGKAGKTVLSAGWSWLRVDDGKHLPVFYARCPKHKGAK